jgi:Uma2 family endonuclease
VPVTAALEVGVPESGYWTVDDLDRLPEDGVRRELIDGVLIVSPSPTTLHQSLAALLCVRLLEAAPDELHVTQGVEVRVGRRRSFIPDVLVTTAKAAEPNPNWFAPHEVVLAVEIVSPTSVSFDRITKPALYAQAGISCYWRVETDGGVVVHTYALDPSAEVYRETGAFTDVITVYQPWEIRLPVRDISRRTGR